MKSVRYVGLDVDAEKIAVAIVSSLGEIVEERQIKHQASAIQKYFNRLREEADVFSCYEAGCFGFGLARQLEEMGVSCVVAAPGLIPRKASDRVKTDRRDALQLARVLRSGDVTAVAIPTEEDETVRDYLRMQEDLKGDLKKTKQRILHFLLRQGLRYQEGSTWTGKHRAWLAGLQFDHALIQETLAEYLAHLADLEEKCLRIQERIEALAEGPRYAEPVRVLKGFKGVQTLTALSLVAEVGDFQRFGRAEQFMAFLGLVPAEHSSGGKRRLGGITKAGNSRLRKLLVEAAWHYRYAYRASPRVAKRRAGLAPELLNYLNRASRRLTRKFQGLLYRNKRSTVAVTAVARELSGFVWGAMVGKMS